MQDYIFKPPVSETQNKRSAHADKRVISRRFAGSLSKRESSDDTRFFNDGIHAKISGISDKTDSPKAAADPGKAVVQRLLNISKLSRSKHENVIEARKAWNEIFGGFMSILPEALQAAFQTAVNGLETPINSTIYGVPDDTAYSGMVDAFVVQMTAYLDTSHSVGSFTDAAAAAGAAVSDMENTAGHTNTQKIAAVRTGDGGVEFFGIGESREHGRQVSNKKQHRKRRERDEKKNALDMERVAIGSRVAEVLRLLINLGMSGAVDRLSAFMTNFGMH